VAATTIVLQFKATMVTKNNNETRPKS